MSATDTTCRVCGNEHCAYVGWTKEARVEFYIVNYTCLVCGNHYSMASKNIPMIPLYTPPPDPVNAPSRYAGTVTPWDLQKVMKTSGNLFVDARRTDAIEYCFRVKDDMLADLKKAKHCIEAAIEEMEEKP